MKDKLVAVIVEDGKCHSLANVKAIDKQEYNKLLNECEEHKTLLIEKDNKHEKEHKYLCGKVKAHDILLAKAIYDNFVDKGFLNNDPRFNQDFYDYFFNGADIDLDKAPEEYKTILAKVVNDYER